MGKKPLGVIVVLLAVVFLWRSSSSGGAGLEDGRFLSYQSSGTTFRVTFADAGSGKLRVGVAAASDGQVWDASPEGDGKVVNDRLRTADGTVLEVASFGPIWVPPGQVKEGGRAHGGRVSEVRSWNGWMVGVVKANIGGALRGEWYYERNTGFLVGGVMGTAFSGEEGGQRFVLRESNVPGLAP